MGDDPRDPTYGQVIYYVQSGDNQLFRCQPYGEKFTAGYCGGDATGFLYCSYILKPLVYNRITSTILSNEDLMNNNSVYPPDTFYNIYIDILFKMTDHLVPETFYYFDNLNNRINIDNAKLNIQKRAQKDPYTCNTYKIDDPKMAFKIVPNWWVNQ